jgi:general secretion pathway protein H
MTTPGQRQAGFTLLELLVVMLIIGIIISFASLSIGQNTSRVVQDEAERLQGLLRMASEEAVLQGRELALEFSRDGYRFLELNSKGDWLPIEQDKLFRERPLPPVVHLHLLVEGVVANFDDKEHPPRILALSSGELTPFELELSIDDGESYQLQGQVDGKLQLIRDDVDDAG